MSAHPLLQSLFCYQAWAHAELAQAVEALDPARHAQERHTALRLLNHCLVVKLTFEGPK